LLGPLPPAQGNLRYVVVAIEYFSKWIEVKPLATITPATVQKKSGEMLSTGLECRRPLQWTMENILNLKHSKPPTIRLERRYIRISKASNPMAWWSEQMELSLLE
jgi:hypothetical protein